MFEGLLAFAGLVVVTCGLIAIAIIFGRKRQQYLQTYLPDVIEQILKQIPKGEHEPLRLALHRSKESARFSSPEKISYWWRSTEKLLHDELGDPTGTLWMEKIFSIFNEAQQAVLDS